MGSIRRGALIVIEGIDRSGKSTQCNKLLKSLQEANIPSEKINFPDRSTITGKLINEYLTNKDCNLSDQAVHLLFAANRWEKFEMMKKLLCDGVTLIVDRYSYSGVAFSSVKKNIDMEWCKKPENGLIEPDLVFLLTLTDEEVKNRPGFGDERYENIDTQRKVAEVFKEFSKTGNNWKVIDASGSVDDVQNILLKSVLEKIEEIQFSPIQLLKL